MMNEKYIALYEKYWKEWELLKEIKQDSEWSNDYQFQGWSNKFKG